MIQSFGNRLAEELFGDVDSAVPRKFAADLRRVARRKLQYLHAADRLQDLAVPPGIRLEALKGDLKGFYSIRINEQWRVVFKWREGGAADVQIVDYH